MSGRLHGTPHSSTASASQNTAPVNEFRCLFTHDIRRKQKRWQDGYLKFHTFNNRVMVYDQARNFLGDTYWKNSHELQEGEELELDKPVMVEVAEALGVTQTDLSLLFEKNKDSSKSQSKDTAPKSRTTQKPMLAPTLPPRGPSSHLRHKSLNTLLGTPRGPIGKATPIESPFEARKKLNNHSAEDRPAKRQKKVHDLVVSRGSSPAANPAPAAKTTPCIALQDCKKSQIPPKPLQRHHPRSDAGSDIDDAGITRTPNTTPPPVSKPPKIPKGKVPVPSVKAIQTPKPPRPPSSPPISASNRITNIDYALQPLRKTRVETESPSSSNLTEFREQPKIASPPPPRKTKTLRLTSGVRRGMLLCQPAPHQQDAALRRQDEPSHLSVRATGPKLKVKDKPKCDEDEIMILGGDVEATEWPSYSISNAKGRKNTASSTAKGKAAVTGCKYRSKRLSETSSDMEIAHGIMDQRLAVPPLSPNLLEINPPELSPILHSPLPEPTDTTSVKSKHQDRETSVPLDNPSHMEQEKVDGSGMARTDSHQSTNLHPSQHLPNGGSTNPEEEPREEIGTNTDKSCGEAGSILGKGKPISLGGFRKKSKRAQRVVETDEPALLSTGDKAPAVFSKPKKPSHVEDDPIQDDLQIISPNRSFRRSRSENDAPIPSISDEWEKQNLPKPSPKNSDMGTGKTGDVTSAAKKRKVGGGLAALVKRTDPRRKFQRTQSLNDNTVPGAIETSIVDLPPDDDVGPWSTEAFDLFDWRPPVVGGEDQGTGLFIG